MNMPPVDTALKVNGKVIELDKFTKSFIASTILGMLSPLRGVDNPDEIESVKIVICGEEVVTTADGVEIGMNSFVRDIVRSTIKAMVSPLRGVDRDIQTVELTLLMPLTNQH